MSTDPGSGPAATPPGDEPPLTSDSGHGGKISQPSSPGDGADKAETRAIAPGVSDTALNRVVREIALDALAHPELNRPPEFIGPWKIVRPLGEGGFGIVYLAERTSPAQQAAVKLIKPGMDTKTVLARFEAERQALALLTHPNIARLYDAGIFDGRPYFAMEYVPGLPITDFCQRHKLDLTARLKLFQQVCHAVQHAHLNAIIHRDISARNVLVTEIDGTPTAKVIDFGIAKAMGEELTDKTIDTGVGNIIGNYAYMSPEQAAGARDIDSRTDVYSLGVLLYELLTGERPFDNETLHKAGDFGIRKLIVETDPPRPSARTTTAEMTAVLRRELEWIPLKALRKDRTRRYQSPADFADDIQNYLDNKPLTAGPESRLYRVRKFAARNRLPLVISSVALVFIVGSTAVYIERIQAEQHLTAVALERADAEAAEKTRQSELARRERDEARKQTAVASAIARFQTDMLTSADPNKVLGDKVTVVEVILSAAKEIDAGKLKDQPSVEIGVRTAIGNTLVALARFDAGEPHLRRALDLIRNDTARPPVDLVSAINNLASVLEAQNKLAEAETLLLEGLKLARSSLPPADPETATTLNNFATVLLDQNRLPEAEDLQRQSIEIRKRAAPQAPESLAKDLTNLALILSRQNKHVEAEPLYRQALQIRRTVLPPGHHEIAVTLANLGNLLRVLGRLGEAEQLLREALDIVRKTLPPDHPEVTACLNSLAYVLWTQGRLEEVEQLCREALKTTRATQSPDHPSVATSLNNLASVLRSQGKLDEAEPLLREALVIWQKTYPDGHPLTGTCLANLAVVLDARDRLAEAEPLAREAIAVRRKSLPPDHPELAASFNTLAGILERMNKPAEAETAYRESLAIYRKALPPDHPDINTALIRLANLLNDTRQHPEAEKLLTEALENRTKSLGPTDARTCRSAFYLAQTLDALNRPEEATALRTKYRLGDPATRPTVQPSSRPAISPATRP